MVKLARSEVLPSGVFENSVDLDRALEMLVTKKVLAERLALSQSYINQLMSKEALPHLKIGRAVRFRVREVVAWLQRRRQP
jgi:excisionase family DNA binding protein